jgi:hypothetical protein
MLLFLQYEIYNFSFVMCYILIVRVYVDCPIKLKDVKML